MSKKVSFDSFHDFKASIRELDEIIYPLTIIYKDIIIRIIEVTKVDTSYLREYFVVVQLKREDMSTRTFTIPCTDVSDFINKLRIEIVRYRFFTRVMPDLASKL